MVVEVDVPDGPAVTILRATGAGGGESPSGLAVTGRHGAGEQVTTPLLPGFGLPVSELGGS